LSNQPFHVFTRAGDARSEVEQLLAELGGTPESTGYHKMIYVTRADQTVVFLTGPQTPVAQALRGRGGWQEPQQGSR
jgi:hypothetical protein